MTLRILIVDDEADIRAFLRLMLSVEGAEVREASSATQCLEMVDDFDPEVVVMDYMMPEMTGEEAALSIRKTHPTARIIGFSGFDQAFPWADSQVSKGPDAYQDLLAAIEAA